VAAPVAPLEAGAAMLPVTALMLLLSARAGALAERIGPRLPMTVGPLLAAGGFLLSLRIGAAASYLPDVLPAVALLGLGLALTVAPLTATVLGAAPAEQAGTASGINNAVARSAGLLAVAVIPVVAGLGGDDYTRPAAFAAGFHHAMLTGAALVAAGGLLAALLVRRPRPPGRVKGPDVPTPRPLRLSECPHFGVTGPQLHPGDRQRAEPTA